MIDGEHLELANMMIAPCPSSSYYISNGDWRKGEGDPLLGMPCSTMRQDNGLYIYAIDIDTPHNENNGYLAAKKIHRHNPEIKKKPKNKFSSTKGYHLLWHVDTCGLRDEYSIMEHFRCITSRIYYKLKLERLGLTLGRGKNVDSSIYRYNGVVKLCGNNGHGRFSVPINLEKDTLTTIFKKSIGQIPFELPEPPPVLQWEIPQLHREIEPMNHRERNVDGPTPEFLKQMEREDPPTHLWALTRFAHFELGLSPKEIYHYYRKNASWFSRAMIGKHEGDIMHQITKTIRTAKRKNREKVVPEWLYEVK